MDVHFFILITHKEIVLIYKNVKRIDHSQPGDEMSLSLVTLASLWPSARA